MELFSVIIREIKNFAHLILAIVAIYYYGNPSKRLKVIGVTGTDGKTTTSSFIYQLLELSGEKAVLISTVGVFMEGKRQSLGFHVTTPSLFAINKYLKEAVEKDIRYVVLEVSSHALDQYRVYGINFEVGMITNITKEHLDYHRTMDRYIDAKVKLLKMSKKIILNLEDPYFEKIKSKIKGKKISTYSMNNSSSNLKYSSIKNSTTEKFTFYNKNNLMAAILVLDLLGVAKEKYSSKLDKLKLPEGRFQSIQEKPFKVVIDFAHTPNAFSSFLPEAKRDIGGRLIHVFGSAGKRDRSKRSDMGDISSQFADVIILTAEDPRGEKIADINNDIKKGIDKDFKDVSKSHFKNDAGGKFTIEVSDRKEAIKLALQIAKKGDVVAITGKGPEESMNMGNGEIPWSDISIAKKLLGK